jgi:hypothetical protein
MRVCHCILGKNGRCCQDQEPGIGYTQTTNTLVANQTYTYGLPRRVRKSTLFGSSTWVVTNHPAGTRSFPTWRQAMDYASAGYYLMNTAVN